MAAFFGTPAARAPAPRRRGRGPAGAALMVRVPGREAQGTALGAMGRRLYDGFYIGFARSYTVFLCFSHGFVLLPMGSYMVLCRFLYGLTRFYTVLHGFV